MADDLETRVRAAALKFALENAVKHGSATAGAVVGKVMGTSPELRAHGKDVPAIVAKVVAEVNAMSPDERASRFAGFADEVAATKRKDEKTGPLKALPNATKGKVVLRLAPNPSGPPHFGHGRGMVINWVYREMYDGTFILRYDDTDTTVKPPWMPAYDMFQETMEWLCGKPDRVIRASDRIERHYEVAEQAFKVGGLYVCECEGDAFRAFKERSEDCPHRAQTVETNLAKWHDMLAGKYRRGTVAVRVKTSMQDKDPALRDWVAFRIAEEPHPRPEIGDRYKVWPLLDFQSAIDDHDEGVTHIIRGKDLRDSTAKQEFLYAHLGWTYPETTYWGRVSVHEFGKFSKSILNKAIDAGEYTGWDDPRLPTFPALRRRGIRAEAIRNFWITLGISEKDIAASVTNLEAENRKIVEPTANRYFFVADPVELTMNGHPRIQATAAKHPDRPERGTRHLVADGRVLIPRADAPTTPGALLRLKDLANVRVTGTTPLAAEHEGNDLAFLKRPGATIVQWTPTDAADATLLMVTGDGDLTTLRGKAERALLDEPIGAVVQLERVGYARVDDTSEDAVTLVYAHK